ncbi:ABC transporter substrate-binding protein [Clostridium magnum]|nr:ABC transporter substrate-binding protein [Clostridium magnum]SHH24321.1 peptide/nickel transport system substrate-binding protein [Clostridium magnum DSM 2767]
MNKFFKNVLGMILSSTISLSLMAGCANSKDKANVSKKGGEVTIGVTSFADTLEPTEQSFSWVITRYGVGENLVRFNEKGEVEPCLAESWQSSEGGKTWTFKIRKGVKFSNGDDMTPEMVKKSLERTFKLSKRAVSFFEPASIEVDGQNLKITTKEPVAVIPGSLADPLFLIVDTNVDTASFAMKGPICTGPYAVESFKPTDSCVVIKNKNYWNGDVPLDKVTFKCIEDQTTRSMSLQTGEVDIAYNLKAENLAEFKDTDKYNIQKLQSLRSTFAFMNHKGPLSDLKLRQALIRGLDKQTYSNVLLEGGAIAGKAPVPPTLDFGFKELKDENSYNPEGAKALLKEAGYKDIDGDGFVETPDGKPLQLNFVIYTSRKELSVYAQAAQVSLKEIGLNVKLNTVSYETMLHTRESGKFDLLIWNVLVANTGDPEKYLRENWYSTSSTNQTGYKNAEVDKLLNQLSKEFDKDSRKKLIIQIQQLIMDDAATVFFGYETTYLFSSKRVKGVTMYPTDYYWLTKDITLAK